jgi:hypothetical protein
MKKLIEELHPLRDKLKADGFKVYTTNYPSSEDQEATYIYFTDGHRIGYAQFTTYDGLSFFTVHKPNRSTGTGFRATDQYSATESDYEKAFTPPAWAHNMESTPFASWEDFTESHGKYRGLFLEL